MMTNLFLIIKKSEGKGRETERERGNGVFILPINNDLHRKEIDDPIQFNSFSCISKQAKKLPLKLKRRGEMTKGKNCTDVYKTLYDYVYYCIARRYMKENKKEKEKKEEGERRKIDE